MPQSKLSARAHCMGFPLTDDGFRFVPHCNKALRSFNLHFNRDGNGQLSFYKKIPKQFQEGFNSYRQHYYVRKKARKAAKAAGSGQRQSASLSNSSSKQPQRTKLSVAATHKPNSL